LRPIGCTQSTEIISTPGVVLAGPLPPGHDLSTMYTAAVTAQAANAKQAHSLIDLLIGADQDRLRQRAGFVDAQK
jgi:molybdate transport system substrate-binding protein